MTIEEYGLRIVRNRRRERNHRDATLFTLSGALLAAYALIALFGWLR